MGSSLDLQERDLHNVYNLPSSLLLSSGQENIDGIMKPVYARLDYHACKSLADLRSVMATRLYSDHADYLAFGR